MVRLAAVIAILFGAGLVGAWLLNSTFSSRWTEPAVLAAIGLCLVATSAVLASWERAERSPTRSQVQPTVRRTDAHP